MLKYYYQFNCYYLYISLLELYSPIELFAKRQRALWDELARFL